MQCNAGGHYTPFASGFLRRCFLKKGLLVIVPSIIRRLFDTMRSQHPNVVVVLGARSGTSALAGTLGLLGLQLPKNLMPANRGNVKGHYEPQDLADLHDRLLALVGSAWDDHREFPRQWFGSEEARTAETQICAAYRENYPIAQTAVLKEPRMCRLLPIWYRAFATLGLHPAFCFIDRNPMEVATSLHKRDGSSIEHGLLYYIRNHLDAEYDTRKTRRVFLKYDDLLADWRQAADKIRKRLKVPISPSSEQILKVSDFLEDDLRHDQAIAPIGPDDVITQMAFAVHDAFNRLSKNAEDRTALNNLDDLRRAFNRRIVSAEQESVA